MILQGSVQCPLKPKDKFPIDFNENWSVPILLSFCFILVVELWLPAARLITRVDIPSPQPWGNLFHTPACLQLRMKVWMLPPVINFAMFSPFCSQSYKHEGNSLWDLSLVRQDSSASQVHHRLSGMRACIESNEYLPCCNPGRPEIHPISFSFSLPNLLNHFQTLRRIPMIQPTDCF